LIAPSALNSQSDKDLKLRDHSCRVPYPERPNFFAAELAANLLFLLKVNGISIHRVSAHCGLSSVTPRVRERAAAAEAGLTVTVITDISANQTCPSMDGAKRSQIW
jgi:hypothetical protein